MRSVDAVIIGSGHNGLVTAAYLARAGWEVEVLERNDALGGAVATEELTEPGFWHDTFSSWHPLFHLSGAWQEIGEELASRGLAYENTEVPAASALPGERTVLWHRDPERAADEFSQEDTAAYRGELELFGRYAVLVGELLATELFSTRAATLVGRLAFRLGYRDGAAFANRVFSSARAWLTSRFDGPEVPGLLAPWVLHTGLSPDGAGGGFQLLALVAGVHQVGMPVVRGGSANFVRAFARLIEDHAGRLRTGVEVEEILVSGGRAVGVRTGDEVVMARRAVVANVTPTQLYGRLLPGGTAPERAVRQASRYRYGRGGMQIHLALSEPLAWRDPRLREAAIVHVTDGLDGVSVACAQAQAGLLPGRPTVVCGQPTVLDPSRAPEGREIAWIQLQETPYAPRGDAAGELDTRDGRWTLRLVEAYAERVLELIGEHVENLPGAVLSRRVLSPAELERCNPNFVRGDSYAGATDLDQSYVWRPLPSYGSHVTPVEALCQCGASTYPGPGLNAASGRIVARRLLRKPGPVNMARRMFGRA
jgi:phytoene dehydrogenase-like protein